MSYISFGAFVLISIIVLIIITEGEGFEVVGDGLGGLFETSNEKRKMGR
jgi:hypothetical protein